MSKADAKAVLAEQAYQRALDYQLQYGCCPQCVLASVQDVSGYVSDETIKASHGLSGGGGLQGDGMCGALTGGLLALGAKGGRERDKFDQDHGSDNFEDARELVERFRDAFGGLSCKDLQAQFTGRTYDLWKAEEFKVFNEARGTKCAEATAIVARWVVEKL